MDSPVDTLLWLALCAGLTLASVAFAAFVVWLDDDGVPL